LKGEVTAIFDQDFEIGRTHFLFLEFNGSLVPYFLEDFSDRGDKAFLKFESIDSIKEADLLKGRSVFSPKTIRPKLKRGQFYDDEVVGFSVEDETVGELEV